MSRPIRYCEVEGCGERRFGQGFCAKHYARFYRGNDPQADTRFTPNEIVIKGDVSEIILRNKKMEEIGRAVVDTEDLPLLTGYIWSLNEGSGYAYSHSKGPTVMMHRLIAKTPNSLLTDHKDCNGLNNRKYNLRQANDLQNAQNMSTQKVNKHSKYKGVSLLRNRNYPLKKPWIAYIGTQKKRVYLGYYETEEAAALAYDNAARQHFGEFARPNFVS